MNFLPQALSDVLKKAASAALGFALVVLAFIVVISLLVYDMADTSLVASIAEFFQNSIGILASLILAVYSVRAGYFLLFENRPVAHYQVPLLLGVLSVLLFAFGMGLAFGGAGGGILGVVASYDFAKIMPGLGLYLGLVFLAAAAVIFVKITGLRYGHLKSVAGWFASRKNDNAFCPDARTPSEYDIENIKPKRRLFSSSKTAPKKVAVKKLPAKTVKKPGGQYKFPPLDILEKGIATRQSIGPVQRQSAVHLRDHLAEFGVEGDVVGIKPGPVVTLYEFEPGRGVKTSKIIETVKDITRVMASENIRMAHIPGTNVIGIELPNLSRQDVRFQGLMANPVFQNSEMGIPIALGVNIGGEARYVDLARMPHLMIAGRTGTGKSVFIQSIILSILYKFRPDECKLILIDPKGVDFTLWDGIPHLLTPVVTDPMKSVKTLKWTVAEMEKRYARLKKHGVQNLEGYNEKMSELRDSNAVLTEAVATGTDPETGSIIYETRPMDLTDMPYLVLIIDEMADLMMTGGKEVEACLQRLAQKARAAGIHVVIATQRPSVETITGVIKANFPTRISFQTLSAVDSITILAAKGAEQLLPRGDMLYLEGGRAPVRIHAAYISGPEAHAVAKHLRAEAEPDYIEGVGEDEDGGAQNLSALIPGLKPSKDDKDDELYRQAVEVVIRDKKPTVSYVQRALRVGYNKAAIFIERMEKDGIITPPDANNKRRIR
ncbi:MAG: FtsK/SpoIIIE domain-containing protein [Alphaproteobacteria bacterium]|nr:FtsK/SpoIIIE domain-containing protein [Alphaproteobacteria bacterium]